MTDFFSIMIKSVFYFKYHKLEKFMSASITILIVDDDQNLLMAFSRLLERAGYQVITAETGAKGLRLAKEWEPNLIILDVVLPDMSGNDLCQRLKSDPQFDTSLIVMLSAIKTSSENQAQGLENGADDYILRPISNRELLARVQTYLRLQRVFQERDSALGELRDANDTLEAKVAARTAELQTELVQHRQTQANLKASEARYRTIFESANDFVFLHTSDTPEKPGSFIEASTTACERLGYSCDELRTLRPTEIISDEDQGNVPIETEDWIQDRTLFFEKNLITKSGDSIPVEVQARFFELDGQELILSIGRDLTRRKQAEAALRKNEQLLLKIAENYPNAYLSIIEKDMTIGFTSGQLFAKQNLDPNQFVGLPLEAVFGEQTATVRAFYEETFKGAEQSFELFINNQYQEYRTVPLRSPAGAIHRILVVVEDITAIKQAEIQHEESEARFYAAFQTAPVASEIVNFKTGERKAANNHMLRRFGYSEEDLLAENILVRSLAADQNETRQAVEKILETGSIENYPLDIVTKSGEVRNTLVHAAMMDPKGSQEGIISFFDITELKQTERELRESQEKFSSAFYDLAVPASILDFETGIRVDVNTKYLEVFGYSREELVGKNFQSKNIAVDEEEFQAAAKSVSSNETLHNYPFRMLTKAGEPRNVLVSSARLHQTNPNLYITSYLDVTEQLAATNALAESEKKFRTIFDKSPNFMILADLETMSFVDINQKYTETMGFPAANLVGIPGKLGFAMPDKAALAQGAAILKETGHLLDYETNLITKTGAELAVALFGEKITIQGQGLYLIMVVDISERKRTEIALQKSENRLRALAQKVITAQEDERQWIARELHDESGQMLTALNIQLEMIQASLPTVLHTARENLADANELLKTAMRDLRNLAHGLRPPVLDTLALDVVIQDLCRDFCDRVGLSLDYQADPIPELSEIERIILYRFTQEALTNIAKHAQGQKVKVYFRQQDDHVCLMVKDDGVGFDQSQTPAAGMGIESIIERLMLVSGRLDIHSELDLGTCLIAKIPIQNNRS
jgi:PAS domain S-box-containing protein